MSLLGVLCVLVVDPSCAGFAGELTLAAEAAFGAVYRPGCPLPVRLTFTNSADSVGGELAVTTPGLRYFQPVDLPSPTTRQIELDAVFFDEKPAVTATITQNGEEVFSQTLDLPLRAPAEGEWAVGVLGREGWAERFRDIRDAAGPAIWGRITWLPVGSPQQYQALDLIVVDASHPRDLPEPPSALIDWLACGGRLMISLPAEAGASGPWVNFTRSSITGRRQHPTWRGLSSFPLGLGRVAVVSYGDHEAVVDPAARKQLAQAIVEALRLRPFPRVGPVQPQLYAALRPVGWTRSDRGHIALMVGLYPVLMALVLLWSGHDRQRWITAIGLSACSGLVVAYLLLMARPQITACTFAVLHTVAGDHHARCDLFAGLGTAKRHLTASVALASGGERFVGPLYYDWSDVYRLATDVHPDGTPRLEHLTLSRDTWRCFASWRAMLLESPFLVIGGRLTQPAQLAGNTLTLQDAIVTDGRRAVVLDSIAAESVLELTDDAVALSEAVFASLPDDADGRRDFLQWWTRQPRQPGPWLVGWVPVEAGLSPFDLPAAGQPAWMLCTVELQGEPGAPHP